MESKKLKIIYTSGSSLDSANLLTISTPYNTFVDIPDGYTGLDKAEVYIMDAYFSLLDGRRIYSHILYLVHTVCGKGSTKKTVCDTSIYDEDTIRGYCQDNRIIPPEVEEEMPITCESPIEEIYPGISDFMDSSTGDSLVDLDSEYL